MSTERLERSPAEIEANIQATRAALDSKLSALEHKLSPREQLARMRSKVRHVDRDAVAGWGAVSAIAVGTVLALAGWRRYHANGRALDLLDLEDDLADVVLLDCSEAPPAL